MPHIGTFLGASFDVLKTTGVAWTAVNGTEQVSVAIPIAIEDAAGEVSHAGICLNVSLAISAGTTDDDVSFDIYGSSDNSTRDTDALVTNTITTLVATTPDISTWTYRMDELAPSIICGFTRDGGDRVIALTLTAFYWDYQQLM